MKAFSTALHRISCGKSIHNNYPISFVCTHHVSKSQTYISRKFSQQSKGENNDPKINSNADNKPSTSTSDESNNISSQNSTSPPSSSTTTSSPSSSTPPALPCSTNSTPSSNPTNPSPMDENATSSYAAVQKRIGSTLHFAEQKYEDFEQLLMIRIHESNRRRFRIYFFGLISFLITSTFLFGDRIRRALTQQTADIAKETLENESLQIQTQELAMAVVQTVLNDKQITAHAAVFLKEASTAAETQQALLELTLHVLQHPQTLEEVYLLLKRLLHRLSEDKEVQQQLISLLQQIFQDPKLQGVLVQVVMELCKDPEIIQSVSDLLVAVSVTKEVTDATMTLLQTSTTEVIQDEELLHQSRQFVTNVMGDDLLQQEGGNALWNTMYHALKPGVIRYVI